MRAKVKLNNIQPGIGYETLTFNPVCKPDGYDSQGLDEDNTYSKFTPIWTIHYHNYKSSPIRYFSGW